MYSRNGCICFLKFNNSIINFLMDPLRSCTISLDTGVPTPLRFRIRAKTKQETECAWNFESGELGSNPDNATALAHDFGWIISLLCFPYYSFVCLGYKRIEAETVSHYVYVIVPSPMEPWFWSGPPLSITAIPIMGIGASSDSLSFRPCS